MAIQIPWHKVCNANNFIYGNSYSNSYRATLKVGNEKGIWDIMHISLPFLPIKEAGLVHKYNLSKDKLTDFYVKFGECIKNSVNITNFLADSEVSSIVRYASYNIQKKEEERGSDIYLITKPMQKVSDYLHLNAGDTIHVLDIVQFGARMMQIIKNLNAVEVHAGAIDIDSLYILNVGDKNLITLGGLLYAAHEAEAYIDIPKIQIPHMHISILDGEKPTLATDMYSVCSIMWTLLNGDHYSKIPNMSVYPKYSFNALNELLVASAKAMNFTDKTSQEKALRTTTKDMHGIIRQIKNGAAGFPNNEIHISAG